MKRARLDFKVRSILCPVDFSADSRHALRYASAVAQRFGARLTVLFVNDPLLMAAGTSAYGGRRQFLERTKAEMATFVTSALAAAGRPQHVALQMSEGNPSERILATAKRAKHDLIVIGTQGLNRMQRLFFGSTTEQILHDAMVPVLAIPALKGRRGSSTPLSITRVVAPIDLAGEWQSDVTHAAAAARAFEASLVLVHVVADVQTPPWLPNADDDRQRREEKARKALDRVIATFASGVPASAVVLAGDAARQIANLAAAEGSLLVMSLRGTASVWGRRGSIAWRVLTESASTPLLALPRRRLGGPLRVRAARAIKRVLDRRDRAELAGIDGLVSAAAGRRSTRS